MKDLIEYEINISKARKTIFHFFWSSLLLVSLIVVTDNKFSSQFDQSYIFFSIFILLYFFCLFLLAKRFFKSFYSQPKIILSKESIFVPTFYLGMREVKCDKIYSLEVLPYNKKNEYLVLGVANKNRVFIDEILFSNSEGYKSFKKKLKKLVEKNVNEETVEAISKISVFQRKRFVAATIVISAISVIIYFLSASGSLEPSENSSFIIQGAGRKDIFLSGDFYRLFSSTFLHISIFHLLLNLFVLGVMGELLEKVITSIRFINIFLLSAILGYLSFIIFSDYEAGVGASGGIFGLWGAYFSLKFRYEKYLPGSVNAIPLQRLACVLVIELLIETFLLSNVGVEVHLGGFFIGFIYLYFMPLGPKLETVDQPTIYEKGLFVVLVSCYTIGLSYFLLLYYGLI